VATPATREQGEVNALLAVCLLLEASAPPWKAPFAYGPVRLAQVEGRTLCVRNPDGTALLVDGPVGPGWQWYEYDGGGGWFAARRTPDAAEFQEGVDFARIWGRPTCERLRAHTPDAEARHDSQVDSCETTDFPEPGTLRVALAHRFRTLRYRSVSYYTPHGYNFSVSVKDGIEDPDDIALMASYRLVADRGCGPVPEHPRKRRTTTR
jgi:hypothetical protein